MAAPIWSDEYTGPRWTYGLTYRPIGLANVPKGFLLGSDKPHPRFRFGTIDYPFQLDAFTVNQMDLIEVDPDPAEDPGPEWEQPDNGDFIAPPYFNVWD